MHWKYNVDFLHFLVSDTAKIVFAISQKMQRIVKINFFFFSRAWLKGCLAVTGATTTVHAATTTTSSDRWCSPKKLSRSRLKRWNCIIRKTRGNRAEKLTRLTMEIHRFKPFFILKITFMLTLLTCRSLDTCFLTLWGKHDDQSINIYYLGKVCIWILHVWAFIYLLQPLIFVQPNVMIAVNGRQINLCLPLNPV